jgi:hypothetical protein
MAGSSFNAATPPTGSAASPAAVQTAAKHRQRQQQQSQQGDGSGDGGGQGDGSQPDDGGGLGDTNLSPTTGQQSNPEAADLVNRSRAGDKSATQTIQETMRADRAGDPRARVLAQGILEYTKGHAEFAGEMLTGHAANLSHSHPLTQRRVKRIGDDLAATFGAEGHRVYLAHVASPFGPPSGYKPAFMGQVVGRAQAMQAARFPMGGVRFLSPKAARELGE